MIWKIRNTILPLGIVSGLTGCSELSSEEVFARVIEEILNWGDTTISCHTWWPFWKFYDVDKWKEITPLHDGKYAIDLNKDWSFDTISNSNCIVN